MYKIYINQKRLLFGKNIRKFPAGEETAFFMAVEIADYYKLAESLLLQKNTSTIFIKCSDVEKEFQRFCKSFKVIRAAGGLVKNKNKEYLMIFRNGLWDLPKGKIDKGETDAQAAMREVTEETAVNKLQISRTLATTWHLLLQKDKIALKETIWFTMRSNGNRIPVPQTKEDITLAVWKKKEEIPPLLPLAYRSIADLMAKALKI